MPRTPRGGRVVREGESRSRQLLIVSDVQESIRMEQKRGATRTTTTEGSVSTQVAMAATYPTGHGWGIAGITTPKLSTYPSTVMVTVSITMKAYILRRNQAKLTCESYAGVGNCMLYDDGGVSKAPHCMPACQQRFNQWCWATTVASIASYWEPDRYTATGPDTCMGISCEIASRVWTTHGGGVYGGYGRQVHCCPNHGQDGGALEWDNECNQPNSLYASAQWLNNETGKHYVFHESFVPNKMRLQDVLRRGPIIALISWGVGRGGHYILIAGTNGLGDFWVHDPFVGNQAGKYEILTYAQISRYSGPGFGNNGTWIGTFYQP